MPSPTLFVIDYCLHGAPKSFVIRLDRMDNAEAWHWASCDAGVGHIPRHRHDKIKRTSKPMAEKFGITEVRWRAAGMQPPREAPMPDRAAG
jgi:hypothetical protein